MKNFDIESTNSFFDDPDPQPAFEFVKPSQKHSKFFNTPPTLGNSMTCKDLATNKEKQGFYSLYGLLLVYYEDEFAINCDKVLEISHSRVKQLTPGQNDANYGFTLTKNGKSFLFTLSERRITERWVARLKSICVLTNFHEEYKASKVIGKGGFAKVYRVESKVDGKLYAVKAFAKANIDNTHKKNSKAIMINEIDIMRTLNHENIIKLHEVHETEKSLYLVMELIEGKPLQSILSKTSINGTFAERQIIEMVRAILSALAYMASQGIMHRDLKPDNILIDKEGKVKIVDFGLATYVDEPEYLFKKCGTPGYIAPEIFKYKHKTPSTAYDGRCDVFSAGCILFYMLFETPFFEGTNSDEVLERNKDFSDFEALYFLKKEMKNDNSMINKDGLDLLIKLLEYDHKKRITATQALVHPYFSSVRDEDEKNFNSDNLGYFRRENRKDGEILFKMLSDSAPVNSPLVLASGNRFTEKDSLYLDMGKPDINGNVTTLTNGSRDYSLVAKTPSTTSNNNSLSAFAKQNNTDGETKGESPSKRHLSAIPANNRTFLKAAIYNSIHKNNGEALEPAEVPKINHDRANERRHTDFPRTGILKFVDKQNMNLDNISSEMDDFIWEDCPVQRNLETINSRTPIKHPSKVVMQTKKVEA